MESSNETVWQDVLGDLTPQEQALKAKLRGAFKAEAERIRLGRELQDRLREMGLSQKQLAERLSMQPAEVNRILKGRSNVTANSLLTITNELGLRLEYVKA